MARLEQFFRHTQDRKLLNCVENQLYSQAIKIGLKFIDDHLKFYLRHIDRIKDKC